MVLRGVRVVVVARAGSRTWGETYTRPPKFATTTAAGGRVLRPRVILFQDVSRFLTGVARLKA